MGRVAAWSVAVAFVVVFFAGGASRVLSKIDPHFAPPKAAAENAIGAKLDVGKDTTFNPLAIAGSPIGAFLSVTEAQGGNTSEHLGRPRNDTNPMRTIAGEVIAKLSDGLIPPGVELDHVHEPGTMDLHDGHTELPAGQRAQMLVAGSQLKSSIEKAYQLDPTNELAIGPMVVSKAEAKDPATRMLAQKYLETSIAALGASAIPSDRLLEARLRVDLWTLRGALNEKRDALEEEVATGFRKAQEAQSALLRQGIHYGLPQYERLEHNVAALLKLMDTTAQTGAPVDSPASEHTLEGQKQSSAAATPL